MAHEQCDNCRFEYDFSPEVATLNLFINDPVCNYIMAVCPQCHVNTRIFLTGDAIVHILTECKLGMQLAPSATDDLKAAAASMYGEADIADELPAAPKWMLRELYDDLREWKGEPL